MNKKWIYLILALVSGLLLALSWPGRGIAPLIFIAFIPLLYVTDQVLDKRYAGLRAWPYIYFSFVIWNVLTTYWIMYASAEGAILAIFANSYFMSIVWMLFMRVKKIFGTFRGYVGLILLWLAFEYLHLDWDLSWPWLQIGNVFANNPQLIQWYEVTGNMGGTLWVLLVNIFIYETVKEYRNKRAYFRSALITSLLLIVPISISMVRYATYKEKENPIHVVCIQPNIDPWQKFGQIPAIYQLNHLIELSVPHLNANTDYLIFPETAIPVQTNEDSLHRDFAVDTLQKVIAPYPKLKIITGISSYKFFKPGSPVASSASLQPDGWYYDDYNAAVQIGNGDPYQVYHKSKLVPGPEMFPFAEALKPLQKRFFTKLGGQIGDFGTQKERSVFVNDDINVKAAPVICYESIYGAYCGEYVQNGANFIAISTNDAWWGDRPGYKQLLAYARLRSIETRRSIARSANTGISCFINQRGDVISPTKYNTSAAIEGTINGNDHITFYVEYGDYLGRAALWLSMLLLVFAYIKMIFFKKRVL